MKKKQPQKKRNQSTNRHRNRRSKGHRQPTRPTNPQPGPRSSAAMQRFQAKLAGGWSIVAAGDPLTGLVTILGALAETSDPDVRRSATYWDAEGHASSFLTSLGPDIVRSDIGPDLLRLMRSGLSRHLSLSIYLGLLEPLLASADISAAKTIAARAFENVQGLDNAHEGGIVTARGILADRLFQLGDFAGAEQQWNQARASLHRSGRLDAVSHRMLAANVAISRWRAGDEKGAIGALEESLSIHPPAANDAALGLYPVIGYVELLRNAGRAAEARTALTQFQRLLRSRTRPVEADRRSQSSRSTHELSQVLDGPSFASIVFRTYNPPCPITGFVHSPESPLKVGNFHGEAPGVATTWWCTPDELLAVHGPDDELFRASLEVLSLATGDSGLLAALKLIRIARRRLEREHPRSRRIDELVAVEERYLRYLMEWYAANG